MGDDEPQMGHRGEWFPSVKNVLSCETLLLPWCDRGDMEPADHRF